ncbi:MAG: hypothetical protein ACFCUN_09345 [Hyphomicrobiaceae bacterium]
MAYRGSDLTFRAPRGWSIESQRGAGAQLAFEPPEWLASALEEAEADALAEQLWVDDAVLKCCNQAYDLAVAHRSDSVRLEHLIHAMTLVPEGMEALRGFAISDATLRRESAAIIADDFPAELDDPDAVPATSREMEEILRSAAGRAYALRSPVTLDDILFTLFDMKRDIPTRNLLSRHRSDWTLREPIDTRRLPDPPRERVRVSAGRNRLGDLEGGLDDVPSVTDTYQNSRIDALERAVRQLTEALSVAALAPGRQSYEPTETVRSDPSAANGHGVATGAPNSVLERIAKVESAVETRFRELARTWNVLGDRLQTVEDLLLDRDEGGLDAARRGDVERLSVAVERLAGLEQVPQRLAQIESLGLKLDRLDRLDQIVTKLDRLDRTDLVEAMERKLTSVEASFARVLSRLEGLETRLDHKGDVDFDLVPIKARLDVIGDDLKSAAPVREAISALETRIEALSRALMERPQASFEAQALQARLDGLTRMLEAGAVPADGVMQVPALLASLERKLDSQVAGVADLTPVLDRFRDVESQIIDARLTMETLGERIDRFDGLVAAVRSETSQATSLITDEVRTVARVVGQQVSFDPGSIDTSSIVRGVATELGQPLVDLRSQVEADRREQREHFEYLVDGLGKSSEDQRRDFVEVNQAMLKLNQNQQTLAQSMDRWRLDVTGDLGVLASRLATVERLAGEPSARMDQIAQRLEQMSILIERKEQRRSGFLMWLFGTEDWWSDGWRTPEEREEARRRAAQVYAPSLQRTQDGKGRA